MKAQIFIETPRLILREVIESDAPGFFDLDSDPEVHKYLGNQHIQTIQECEEVIQYIRKQYQENGIGRWAIIDKATQDFIGWSGLKYETGVREMPYYDLGYRLRRKYWGKGIATETALESLKYGFTKLNYPEISAAAHVENIGSNKVLQKVGLSFVETFKFDAEEHNWYSISQADWLKMETS